VRGGRLVAAALAANQSGPVFTLCGDHITATLDGCAEEGLRVIDARHEAAAGFMAEGWALATGRPGVVLVTGGPGLTNVQTPVADASMAGVPMVVLTGAIRQSERGGGHPQDVDHHAALAPFTRWSETVRSAGAIPGAIADAFGRARSERGPVLLELPLDVQLAEAREPDLIGAVYNPVLKYPKTVKDAGELLRTAERPLILAGEGAFWSGAGPVLRELAETARIPVFTLRAGRGLLPDDHELALGQPNFLSALGQLAFSRADVVLSVGAELDIVVAFGHPFAQAKLIRIEADADRVRRHREPDVAVVGDEASCLQVLAHDLEALPTEAWLKELRAAQDPSSGLPSDPDRPAHPSRLVEALAAIPGPATFSVDAGELALWAIGGLPAHGPGRLLSSFATPLATLGNGIPFAIAAKLARPKEPSVALVGDGAFGLQAMELDTAVRHGIDVKVVIGNDRAWGIVKRQAEMGFGRSVAADLPGARYEMVAQGLGATGERATTLGFLAPALGRAMRGQGTAVVDVVIDPEPVHPAMRFISAMFAPEGS
jgi:acetolactate synthase-1/2/3 large subunit